MNRLVIALVVALTACRAAGVGPSPLSLPAGVEILPVDTPAVYCRGPIEEKLAVFSIDAGARFWDVFPNAGKAPELDELEMPLLVVAYRGMWPGRTTGVPGREVRQSPMPGTIDVCVETVSGDPAIAGEPFIVYGDIPTADALVAP